MRFILSIVILLCFTTALTKGATDGSDDEQVDVVIDDDGNEQEETISADSYGVIVKDGKIIRTKNGKPIETESPPKPKPSINIDVEDVHVDLDEVPESRPKPKPTPAPVDTNTDDEEVVYDIDERFNANEPDGIRDITGLDKVVLGVQISGALIKLTKKDQRANFELDQMISATREKRSGDYIYNVEAILAPRNDRCHLILLEQEDADYQKLNVKCGRKSYEVINGTSREQRIRNEKRQNHRQHERPLYDRLQHAHHDRGQ